MEKNNLNIVDQFTEQVNNQPEPDVKNNASALIALSWVAFAFSIIVPVVGCGAGLYAYLSNTTENPEVKTVSLMSVGISAFILIMNFMFMII